MSHGLLGCSSPAAGLRLLGLDRCDAREDAFHFPSLTSGHHRGAHVVSLFPLVFPQPIDRIDFDPPQTINQQGIWTLPKLAGALGRNNWIVVCARLGRVGRWVVTHASHFLFTVVAGCDRLPLRTTTTPTSINHSWVCVPPSNHGRGRRSIHAHTTHPHQRAAKSKRNAHIQHQHHDDDGEGLSVCLVWCRCLQGEGPHRGSHLGGHSSLVTCLGAPSELREDQ